MWSFAGGITTVELDSNEGPIHYGCPNMQSCTDAEFGNSFEYLSYWQDFFPKVVPITGGLPVTVYGNGFDISLSCSCSFLSISSNDIASARATVLNTSQLICDEHNWTSVVAMAADLRINCSGALARRESNATLLHTVASVESIVPSSVSTGGGTMVTLHGINFCDVDLPCAGAEANYTCIFVADNMRWNSSVVPTTVSRDTVLCAVPNNPFIAPDRVRVLLLRQSSIVWADNDIRLELFEAVTNASVAACSACSCSKSHLPCLSAATSHAITVSGNGFNPEAAEYVCIIQLVDSKGVISSLQSSATRPSSMQHFVCLLPMLPQGVVAAEQNLSVYRNGKRVYGSLQVEYYPEWTALSQSLGSAHGCTTFESPCHEDSKYISLHARGLNRSKYYVCTFRDSSSAYFANGSAFLAVSETEAQCEIPEWHGKASVVEVILTEKPGRVVEHSAQFSNAFVFKPIIMDLMPRMIFLSNSSTAIIVQGFGFPSGTVDAYECRLFSTVSGAVLMKINASVISDRQLSCRFPPLSLVSQQASLRIFDLGPPEAEVAFALNRDGNIQIELFWSQLSSYEALASGGEEIMVIGSGFNKSSYFVCKFSNASLG